MAVRQEQALGLRFERLVNGEWRHLATLSEGDPPGSISDNISSGRDVILFRCCGPYSLIERSLAGADIEIGDGREIFTEGFELLAKLGPGEVHERVVTRSGGGPARLRWTHKGGPA